MKLQKGMLIAVDGIYYVAVDFTFDGSAVRFNCICDHANNVHSWRWEDVQFHLALNELENDLCVIEERNFWPFKREIPWRVIAEVLSGEHDNRF